MGYINENQIPPFSFYEEHKRYSLQFSHPHFPVGRRSVARLRSARGGHQVRAGNSAPGQAGAAARRREPLRHRGGAPPQGRQEQQEGMTFLTKF
jgi:hypothetical protein